MSFNPENYRRIRQEYEQKYRRSRADAEAHTETVENKVPGVREINRTLSGTGLEIFRLSIEMRDNEDRNAAIEQLKAKNKALIARRTALLTAAGYPGDYCDVHYACTACNDSGFLDNGSMCDCMRRALTAEDYRTSGLADFGGRMTFENFSLQYYKGSQESLSTMTRVATHIVGYARNFSLAEGGTTPPSLLFVGKTGLGKTHLSVALGLAVQAKGYDVQYVSAPDLFASFEAERFGSGSGMETLASRRYFDCEFLIIDDLGCEMTNQFTVSCLYNIINSRLNHRRRPTLISTNLFPAELRDRYWDRIASRLTGEYEVLGFSGTDIREQKLRENH